MAGAAPFAELGGRAAIVTGAAQGIGRTAAETLAAHGMAVVIADTNAERGQRVVDGITASGGRAVFAEADVGTRAGCERMVSAAVEHFGGVFALVNNARVGMGHANAPLADILEADWDRSQDVLLKSHFLACKFAIPHMIAGGGGSIVGVSSLHAQQTNDVEGPYVRPRSLPSCPLRKADTLCLPVVWARRRPRPGCRASCAASPSPTASTESAPTRSCPAGL